MKRPFIIGTLLIACLFLAAFVIAVKNADHSHKNDQPLSTAHLVYRGDPVIACALKTPEIVETEIMHYTEDEIIMVAKVLYRECRGIPSATEKACVVWTICNRVDSDEFPGDTIAEVITYPNAFAYTEDTPVWDELYDLAEDVLSRWNAERNGSVLVGRVLPPDYEYFSGDGEHNYFRNEYIGDYDIWDYSLDSPYES